MYCFCYILIMEHKFELESLLNVNIEPYLNKDYIDMLNKLDDLNRTYEDVYTSVSDILDRDIFDDLYLSHMSMSAAFDSSRLGLKGKDRQEILEKSYHKKYKSIENHILILKEDKDDIDNDYIENDKFCFFFIFVVKKEIGNNGYHDHSIYRYWRIDDFSERWKTYSNCILKG